MNALEDLTQNFFKICEDALEPYIGEAAKNGHQKWIKELEEKTKALTLARKTGNYSKLTVTVKQEKLSELNKQKKSDKDEEMPAPTILPPKKRVKKEKVSKIQKTSIEGTHRGSDVIIQEPVVTTIELLDSDDDRSTITRSSRSKTKKTHMPITDGNISNVTEYEDAVSEIEAPSVNSTFVLIKKPHEIKKEKLAPVTKPRLNETVVVEKPTVLQQFPISENHLLTDDESMEEEPPAKRNSKKVMKKGNSYDNSPVKKRVEEYENMKQLEAALPSKANTSVTLKQIEQKKGNVKEKALGFTPTSKSKLPYKTGTPLSSLRSRTPLGRGGPTKISKEHGTAERKTVESSEQKKKKHEETYLKAQQLKEKEKEKVLEMYKLKEERHKMLLQQKAEKHKQLKEEYERKRLLAKQKAAEQKNKEILVDRPIGERENILPKKDNKKQLIYMLKSPPRLPCSDCYDSDEERSDNTTVLPLWAKGRFLDEQEKYQESLSHKLKNTLFCCQSRSVDLTELFGHVEPRKLKRTSSAHWDKPPRFTMLSGDLD